MFGIMLEFERRLSQTQILAFQRFEHGRYGHAWMIPSWFGPDGVAEHQGHIQGVGGVGWPVWRVGIDSTVGIKTKR